MKSFPRKIFVTKLYKYLTLNLKDHSNSILRLWADHCEYILAQRFRRGQQMISLYTKLWEDRALKELFYRFKRQFQRNARGIMMGSVGVYIFDWDKERISKDSVQEHLNEIDYVNNLKQKTIICPICSKRKVIDRKVEGIEYCMCKEKYNKSIKDELMEWEPYLERNNMIIWRKEERSGQYAYKVYGCYSDITADDFLHVQTNLDYRKEWDKTAIALDIIDSDPLKESDSQVIYWEMLWPKLFANRDYVYNRRTFVDRKRQTIIIANKSTLHPNCPVRPNNQRVSEYWSYMVIKPTQSFSKPGLEFILTYFDNPGIVIPPTVTSWVAKTHMPDFLNKMHAATVKYAADKKRDEEEIINQFYSCDTLKDPGYEYPPEPETDFSYFNSGDDSSGNDSRPDESDEAKESEEEQIQSVEPSPPQTTSWWSYLHPYYYFA